jgi:hypothetical protein
MDLKISRKYLRRKNLVLAPNMAMYARKRDYERGEVLQCINLQGSRYILKSEKRGRGGGPVFVGLSLIACPGCDRASCKTVQKYPLGNCIWGREKEWEAS